MSDARPVRGVVVAHGAMAEGMVSAVRKIAGAPADALIPLSNDGRSPQDLRDHLEELGREGPLVVFADLHSGSCCLAALSVCGARPGRAVVTGVNLPILLDFVFHLELPMEELLPRLVEKGRQAIRPTPPTC